MKKIISKLVVMALMLFSSISLFAQSNETIVKDLNEVFKKSLYKTEISIDKDGIVSREDNNGNTFVFSLKDVKDILSDDDGFQNMVIVFKDGKKSKGVVEGKNIESELNVVAFINFNDCEKAIELFKKLIK